MTIEALWYSSYTDGRPPHCRRVSRLPWDAQWSIAIDLAISVAAGRAGWRNVGRIALTGETYWYWPDGPDGDAWWMIPPRIEARVRVLQRSAMDTALHRGHGQCSSEDIVRVLQSWRRTGAWRRHAADCYMRRPVKWKRHPLNNRRRPRATPPQDL